MKGGESNLTYRGVWKRHESSTESTRKWTTHVYAGYHPTLPGRKTRVIRPSVSLLNTTLASGRPGDVESSVTRYSKVSHGARGLVPLLTRSTPTTPSFSGSRRENEPETLRFWVSGPLKEQVEPVKTTREVRQTITFCHSTIFGVRLGPAGFRSPHPRFHRCKRTSTDELVWS